MEMKKLKKARNKRSKTIPKLSSTWTAHCYPDYICAICLFMRTRIGLAVCASSSFDGTSSQTIAICCLELKTGMAEVIWL
mmetsp:Transcript_40828/g.98468  ORF Transcript_40828/g.98468 Transcript_40828/m.98468 type:complete len:80 (-) Transcript_40828:70-309(-)